MFKKKKYTVIRQAISKDLAAFVANYFCMQKQVYDTCRERKYFSPFETIIGYYEGENLSLVEDCLKALKLLLSIFHNY